MEASGASQSVLAEWREKGAALPWRAARNLAIDLGVDVDAVNWDCEKPRTREGFYLMQPGIDQCIARARKYADYADLIWMETATWA